MIVQIYGLLVPEDAVLAAAAGADHIGVVVGTHGDAPDEMGPAAARAIFAAVPSSTVKVALTTAADLDEIEASAAAVRPDILHLAAGPEAVDPDALRALRDRLRGLPLMRTIPVAGAEAVDIAVQFQEVSDYLLLDSRDPTSLAIGATGRTHDWRISRLIAAQVRAPVILAGGLSPENVAQAIRAVRPWGVDSNTHTNRPGRPIRKDPERLRRFVAAARQAV